MKTLAILTVCAGAIVMALGCAADEPFRPPTSHPASLAAEEAPAPMLGETLTNTAPVPDPMPPEMKRSMDNGMAMPMKGGAQ